MDNGDNLRPDKSSSEESGASLEGAPTVSTTTDSALSSKGFKINKRLYIALLILILLILLTGLGFSLLNKKLKQTSKTVVINTQSLSNGTLNKINSNLGNTGTVNTQLTISPSTLFKNSVEIQGKATADSDLVVKGNLTVGGTGNFGTNLSVAGKVTAASLSVGSLTISTVNLSGDFNFGGHLISSGTTPTVATSVAAAGGTADITGNDTSGTVTINTGSGRTIPGEMAIITFHTPFAVTPKVELTPVNAPSAQLFYYVSQSTKFFSIECAATPSNGQNYTFNYFVTQ